MRFHCTNVLVAHLRSARLRGNIADVGLAMRLVLSKTAPSSKRLVEEK